MSKKIKIGVFGAARGMTMIRVLAEHPDAELVAICDKYEPLFEQCRQVERETGSSIAYYKHFDQFMEHDFDAVVLANYAHEHAPFAIRLLRSGRHVISEVLPTETMAQAVELVEAVEQSGSIYAYAENYCYFTAAQEMKKLYQQGAIGEFTHGEGEYVHDCESIWPDITYGDKNHWRNRSYSTFYCTHSLGPIISITGTRASRVVGFETPLVDNMREVGFRGGTSGMIVAQMNNHATVKSLHGHLKRKPDSIWYSVYGTGGMMESDRWHDGVSRIYLYQENNKTTPYEISYKPFPAIDTPLSRKISSHGGGDFYTMHYFLEKILGRSEGKACLDVYQALDMSMPGILAYRSICQGNTPQQVPDFRDSAQRDAFRNDHWCTNPEVAGEDTAPFNSFADPAIPDHVYDRVRDEWLRRKK